MPRSRPPIAALVLALTMPAFALAQTGPAAAPIVRVFLLAGQSNMEGQAVVDLDHERDYNGGRGNLATFLADPANAQWADLRAADGSWAVRDDVFVDYLTNHGTHKHGPLSIGYAVYDGRHHFGPELGIGRVLGERLAGPVLLVKTAWGGKSLAVDFRPPGAGGETGPCYTRMLAEYRAAVASIAEHFPPLAGHRPQLDGLVWFQGWNDACNGEHTAEYAANLAHLIRDLRAEFDDAALPFVVGETGNWDGAAFRTAQRQGCEHPSVKHHTRFVPTRQFLRPAEDSPNRTHGHHWFGNAESYLRAGDALGRAMVELLAARR